MTATVPPVHQPGAGAEPGPDLAKKPRTLIPISVNLLPDEVVRARVGASARRGTLIALAAVVALMVGWYLEASHATDDAQSGLDQANAQTRTATQAQLNYAGLTKTKAGIDSIGRQLKGVTKGDVAWAKLIGRIRAQLPSGMALSGVSATASAGAQTPSVGGAPGTMILIGTSPTEAGVHDFADRLSTVPGLASAFVTSVSAADGKKGVNFNIALVADKASLNTRYAKAGTK